MIEKVPTDSYISEINFDCSSCHCYNMKVLVIRDMGTIRNKGGEALDKSYA